MLFHGPTLVSSSGDIDCGTTTEFFLATRPLAAKKIYLPPLGWRPNPYPQLNSFKESTELGNRLAHADGTDPLENVVDGETEIEEEVFDIEEVRFVMIVFFSCE